jgi:hypothetical protein
VTALMGQRIAAFWEKSENIDNGFTGIRLMKKGDAAA